MAYGQDFVLWLQGSSKLGSTLAKKESRGKFWPSWCLWNASKGKRHGMKTFMTWVSISAKSLNPALFDVHQVFHLWLNTQNTLQTLAQISSAWHTLLMTLLWPSIWRTSTTLLGTTFLWGGGRETSKLLKKNQKNKSQGNQRKGKAGSDSEEDWERAQAMLQRAKRLLQENESNDLALDFKAEKFKPKKLQALSSKPSLASTSSHERIPEAPAGSGQDTFPRKHWIPCSCPTGVCATGHHCFSKEWPEKCPTA